MANLGHPAAQTAEVVRRQRGAARAADRACGLAADTTPEGRVMPLLPRSRCETWLLAGAVWLAACAGLWWALPVVPRAVMRLPKDTDLVSLGPDGTTAVVMRDGRTTESNDVNRIGVDLVEIPSGR